MKVLKKRFHLEFSLEGAAFSEDPAGEVARILRDIANGGGEGGEGVVGMQLAQTVVSGAVSRVRDINGNRVGFYAVSDDEVEV